MKKIKYFYIVLLCILLLSIGYSSFIKSLGLDQLFVTVRTEKDIRITNTTYDSINSTTDTTFDYINYNTNRLLSSLILPSANSKAVFDIEITNLGNVEQGIV